MVDFSSLGYDTGEAPGQASLNQGSAGSFGSYEQATLGGQKAASLAAYGVQQPQSYDLGTTVAGDLALGVPDLLDTVASSLPGISSALGVHRGDVDNKFIDLAAPALDAIGLPGLRDFYAENQGGIHATSGAYGVIAAGMLTDGLMGSAPFVGLLSKSSWGAKALALDGEYKTAMKAVNVADEVLASKGVLGTASFTSAMGDSGIAALSKAGLDPALAAIPRSGLVNKAVRLGIAKNISHAVVFEGVSATLLNQNEFLYSSDMGDNLKNAALGLGIAGTIGGIAAKYAIRKMAASDLVRRATAGALDPTGLESALLRPSSATKAPPTFGARTTENAAKLDEAFGRVVNNTYLGTGQGPTTDQITARMFDARRETPDLLKDSSYGVKQTAQEAAAQEQITQVTTKGYPGQQDTRFAGGDAGLGNHARMIAHNDPGAYMFAEHVAGVGVGQSGTGIIEKMTTDVADRLQQTKDLIADKTAFDALTTEQQGATFAQLKDLNFKSQLTHIPYVNGAAVTQDTLRMYDGWIEPQIKATNDGKVTFFDAQDLNGKSSKVGYGSDGTISLPGRATINNASNEDMLRLSRVTSQHINQVAADPNAVFKMPAKPSWWHLDSAAELLRRNPQANVAWPTGMGPEEAAIEALAQKVDGIASLNLKSLQKTGQGLTAEDISRLNDRFNLPQLTAYQQAVMGTSAHPLDNMIGGAIANGGGDAIRGAPLKDLIDGIQVQKQIAGSEVKLGTNQNSTTGNLFNFLQDDKGAPIRPIIMAKRPAQLSEWLPDNIENRIAIADTQKVRYLSGPNAGPLTKDIQTFINNSPDTVVASNPIGLNDTQISSSLVPFAANQAPSSFVGRALTAVSNAEWVGRDAPELLAARRLREGVDRVSNDRVTAVMQQALGENMTQLANPRKVADAFTWKQFLHYGQGWDFKATPIKAALADGSPGYMMALDDSAANAQKYQAIHQTSMPNSAVLLDPTTKKPIIMSELAHDSQLKMNSVTDLQRIEKNSLLEAQGLPTISYKPYYIPPPNPEGKIMGMTYNKIGDTVPGGAVYANTQADFDRLVAKFRGDPTHPMNQEGNEFRTNQSVKNHASLLDDVRRDMLNPGTTWIQGGKTASGSSLSAQLNLNAIDDAIGSIKQGFTQHGRDILFSNMENSIKAAKMRSTLTTPDAGESAKRFGFSSTGKNVWDYYLDAIQGNTPINSPKSVLGAINAQIEQLADTGLKAVAGSPGAQMVTQAKNDVFNLANQWLDKVNPFAKDALTKSTFGQLSAKLGDAMPFNSVAEMMEAQGFSAKPPSLKALSAKTSHFESTWMLRMMEPVQAFMNLAGVINAAPAVLRHVQKFAGESEGDWAQRIGQNADIFTSPNGESYGVMNAAKLLYNGFKQSWKPGAMDADWQRWVNKGFTTQDNADFRIAHNTMETRSGWDRVMNGDPSSGNKFLQKGIIGWGSYLSDQSEHMSRGWAHSAGFQMAKQLGIDDVDAADNFAHDLANKMIANYNPGNRAPIFQGVVGTPVGLFQGFMWAYYQRMFRYMETGDMRSLATQYATQGASFGLKTVPGFNEVNNLYFKNSDGKNDPYDEIYKRFGQSSGDMLMGGVWGNLPRLVGQKAVDFSSRGDTSISVPVVLDPTGQFARAPAIFSTFKKVATGIGQGIGLFTSNNPGVSSQQVGEILSNTIPNRPIAGIIESTLAHGDDTDSSGQLISKNADAMDTAARILGIRSQTQANELEAFYANKQAAEIRGQKQATLTAQTRGLLRGGDDEQLTNAFQSYVNNGGDPRHFNAWMKRTIQSASITRGQAQAEQLFGKPAQAQQLDRILGAQTGVQAEARQPNPAVMFGTADTMANARPTNLPTDSVSTLYGDSQQ